LRHAGSRYSWAPIVDSVRKLQIHRRRVVALLHQFDLEIAGIGQRDAHLDRGIRAAIAKPVGLDARDIEEGPTRCTSVQNFIAFSMSRTT
jgi:hypothetical protein